MKYLKTYEGFSTEHNVDEILKHYLHCALWTEELETEYDVDNFSEESINKSKADIILFLTKSEPYLKNITDEMIGHDFWLTRNGHGAGFWDREEIDEEDGKILSDICRNEFKEVNVFETDDKTEVTIY